MNNSEFERQVSELVKQLTGLSETFSELVNEIGTISAECFNQIKIAMNKEGLGKYFRSRIKAYEQSVRNQQGTKKIKHGRQEPTKDYR